MTTKSTIKAILQFNIDEFGDLENSVLESAIEFKYLITDYEMTTWGVIIIHKETKFRFKQTDFNYDPCFL